MRRKISYEAPATLSRFHRSDKFVRGIMGPIGSGKSTGCAWEVFRRAQQQKPGPDGIRRTRFAIIRNTYRELLDTTVKTWLDWFPEELGDFSKLDMTHKIVIGDVECEVLFRALDRPQDVKKLLSLELTGAWVNEAREVPRTVIDMLQGRVGRYPSKRDGGPTWWGVFLDTNPPDSDHWWYRLFEDDRPDDWELFRQPSGRSADAENIANLPPKYYERLQAGKDGQWVKIYVDGDYGYLTDGRPIYPEYADGIHCATEDLVPDPRRPIIVGVDFGLTPAATLWQRDAVGRWVGIDELVTEDMGATRFAELLKRHLSEHYPKLTVEGWGDPAGEQRSQVDERTPFQVMKKAGIRIRPTNTNDFTIRRDSVGNALSRLIDGVPGCVISPKQRQLRKALSGGYQYKRIQVAGDERFHDKPDKNSLSHVAESMQYAFVGGGEGRKVVNRNDSWQSRGPVAMSLDISA